MIPPHDIQELTFKDYFEIIKKRSDLIISIVVVCAVLVSCYAFVSPKVYMTVTKIVIERDIPKITEDITETAKGRFADQEYFQTQANILTTRTLAQRVFEKLDLQNDPAFLEVNDPVYKLLSMVEVKPVRNTNVVDLSVKGKNPVAITEIANTWAREFIYF